MGHVLQILGTRPGKTGHSQQIGATEKGSNIVQYIPRTLNNLFLVIVTPNYRDALQNAQARLSSTPTSHVTLQYCFPLAFAWATQSPSLLRKTSYKEHAVSNKSRDIFQRISAELLKWLMQAPRMSRARVLLFTLMACARHFIRNLRQEFIGP